MGKQRCSVLAFQAIPAFAGLYDISMNFDKMSTILMKACLGFLRRVLVITPTAEGKKSKDYTSHDLTLEVDVLQRRTSTH